MNEHQAEQNQRNRIDTWNFSTETVFRVSNLIEDFRHEFLRTEPTTLNNLSTGSKRLNIDFVRRVFTGERQDKAIRKISESNPDAFGTKRIPLCFQFTGSSLVESFRKNQHDEENLEISFWKLMELLKATRSGGDNEELWGEVTELFKKEHLHTTLIAVLEELEEHLSRLKITDDCDLSKVKVDSDTQFRILSLFFIFYSRISIAGEAAATISAVHFRNHDIGNAYCCNGQSECFGYIMESNAKTATDHTVVEILNDGSISTIPNFPKERGHPIYFPSAEISPPEPTDNGKIRDDLFFHCYPIFNPIKKDAKEPVSDKNIFHLVVPVYETDDYSRENPDKLTHVVAGPILGWFFIELNKKTRASILGVKQSALDEKWADLCKVDGKLTDKVIKEIRNIRITLNRFSEFYLRGEMEWAIEQPWHQADAAKFLEAHYHHCDGWLSDKEVNQSPEDLKSLLGDHYSVFCYFDANDAQLVALDDDVEGTRITHILVNAAKSAATKAKDPNVFAPILLKRRPATAIPKAFADREHYRVSLTGKIRLFYELAKMREGERRKGRINEKQSAHFAASHELKKITRQIPKANGHLHIINRLPSVFLMFSLPSAGRLSMNDKQYLPAELYGKDNQSLPEWLFGLIRLSAEVEAIAMPAISGDTITDPEEFENVTARLISKFEFNTEHDRETLHPPTDFAARCLFGTGIVCLLRNLLQHAFEFDNINPNDFWCEKYPEKATITVNFNHIRIENPYTSEREESGGTNIAAEFYFSQLSDINWSIDISKFINKPINSQYICEIPIPFSSSNVAP